MNNKQIRKFNEMRERYSDEFKCLKSKYDKQVDKYNVLQNKYDKLKERLNVIKTHKYYDLKASQMVEFIVNPIYHLCLLPH